jgi:hypothetical protein
MGRGPHTKSKAWGGAGPGPLGFGQSHTLDLRVRQDGGGYG